MFAIVAVFVAGLMVGRTPEYVGKKIEAYEMKMASLVVLVPPATVLLMTALAVVTEAGKKGAAQSRAARVQRDPLRVLIGREQQRQRVWRDLGEHALLRHDPRPRDVLRPLLRQGAGLGARRRDREKKIVPTTAGTLPTHTPLFVAMLVGVVILVGALTFIPALALGPFVEELLARAS